MTPLLTNAGIELPRGVKPSHVCRICGEGFWPGQESNYQRHVADCAVKHEGELREKVRVANEDQMQRPKWADLEYEDFIGARQRECEERGIEFTWNLNRRPKE